MAEEMWKEAPNRDWQSTKPNGSKKETGKTSESRSGEGLIAKTAAEITSIVIWLNIMVTGSSEIKINYCEQLQQ